VGRRAVPAGVRLVAVDFEADDLANSLATAGFRANEPVMVVWEAVTRRRVWHFGLSPAGVAPLLAEYGWTEHEQLGPAEYRTRYLEPAGRRPPISPIERFATAEKTARG
jgi:O-methyltransferase involved in polyketide biosynthesis